MKVVIIEDELLTARDLAECIKKAKPSAEIIATLPSVKEAIAYFKENPDPDLIFSDIQLGDGLSFKIFESTGSNIPVIFCTAYDEYALSAFKAAGIDYILKPFTVKSIAAAFSKYNEFGTRFTKVFPPYSNFGKLFDEDKKLLKKSVLVFYKEKIIPVGIEDIALFYVQNEITHLITFNNLQYFVSSNLEEIEKIVSGQFYRANRQYLVNQRAIKDISKFLGRKLLINLNFPFDQKITVGKLKANHFLSWLSNY